MTADDGDQNPKGAQHFAELYEMLRMRIGEEVQQHRASIEVSIDLRFHQLKAEMMEVIDGQGEEHCSTLGEWHERLLAEQQDQQDCLSASFLTLLDGKIEGLGGDMQRSIAQASESARVALEAVDAVLQCELVRQQHLVSRLEEDLCHIRDVLGLSPEFQWKQDGGVPKLHVLEHDCRHRVQDAIEDRVALSLSNLRAELRSDLKEIRAASLLHAGGSEPHSEIPKPASPIANAAPSTQEVIIYKPEVFNRTQALRCKDGRCAPSFPNAAVPTARATSHSPVRWQSVARTADVPQSPRVPALRAMTPTGPAMPGVPLPLGPQPALWTWKSIPSPTVPERSQAA